MPAVSVIMPVYNAEANLAACLDSIVGQTLQDIEIICVDDGSTDRSPEILKEYAAKDSRIRVVTQENAGAGAARNHGMRFASGKYLSIVDSDDFFDVHMLEHAYARAEEKNADYVVFACDFYDDEAASFRPCKYSIHKNLLPKNDPFSPEEVKKDIFKLFVGWSWDKLISRELAEKYALQFQVQRTTNDMLFVFSALLLAERISVMDEVLAHHRRGEGSLSVTREKSWMCFYNALTELKKMMLAHGLYTRFEQDYLNYCIHFSLWNLDTLKEPTRTLLYNKLRNEWYEELGVTKHTEEYYYNRHEYVKYWNVMQHDSTWTPEEEKKKPKDAPKDAPKDVPKDDSLLTRTKRCLQENGFAFTVKKIWKRIFRNGSRKD